MKNLILSTFFFLLMMQSCMVGHAVINSEAVPPSWAPYYEDVERVRYYYLPDIEVYFDVWTQEFIYLDNGHWIFSPSLPQIYAGYDLGGAHVVILYHHVFAPWNYHHLYLYHYPRYYYYSLPDHYHPKTSRGFNENNPKLPIENEKKFPEFKKRGSNMDRPSERPKQRAIYNSHHIGQPVKAPRNPERRNIK